MNAARAIGSAVTLDRLPAVKTATARSIDDIDSLTAAGEPVVLNGVIDDWPALAAANRSPAELDTYLKARDSGAPVPVMEAPPSSGGRFGYADDLREFSFTRRSRPLGETLDRIAHARTRHAADYLAIQMLALDEQMPGFVRDNPMPLVPSSARPKLWLGGPVVTQIHNDRDHNLACVVAGRRRFVLFPPEQVANLYIGPLDNPPPLSLVDPEAPDLVRYPRFREALRNARVAHLGPGDAILMPRYWWHHVTSLDPYNAMVNYWWGDSPSGLGNPTDGFLTARLAFASLPPWEREYWRAMFETHVFADHGAAHIPPQMRGTLGPLTPQLRASLRQRLKAAALKS
jgi:hypothetical protein